MRGLVRWLPLVAALTLPACGAPKKAAEQALAAAEAAYAPIAAQANDLAPERAKEIESAIAAGNGSLSARNFAAALTRARDARDKARSLTEELPGLRARLEADWKALDETVPGALAALEKKLEDFGMPPAGMPERERFDAAKASLTKLGERWNEARALAGSGKLTEAVTRGGAVRDDAVKALTDFQTGS